MTVAKKTCQGTDSEDEESASELVVTVPAWYSQRYMDTQDEELRHRRT